MSTITIPESPVVEIMPLSAADVKDAQTSPLIAANGAAGSSRL